MNIIGITINHKTAPIELREALHLSQNEITQIIPLLKDKLFSEGFVLSTCNRTEIFGFPKSHGVNFKNVQDLLKDFKPIEGINSNNFLNYFSCGAVKHIFKVASGIDSLVIGDSQILAQVKEAFQISEDMNFTSSLMRRISDSTIKVGRRAISETLIGEGAVTVSFAAIKVIEKVFASFEKRSALVIGAGETGELAAIHLKDLGIGKLTITNRTFSKAENLAEKLNADAIKFENFKDHLQHFDIIISATSSGEPIIYYDDIKAMMKKRKGALACLMDIAIPRDFDTKVKNIDGAFYYDIDSLKVIVDENMKLREKEIPNVEKIIMEEMVNLFGWYNTLEVVPTIKDFRDFFEHIRSDEMEKIKHKVSDDEFEKIDNMTRRMIGRILHNPTINLRKISETGTNFEEVAANTLILKELFGLTNNGKEQRENNDKN
ncbi:MAG: glutamyl-tRNA reductase [Melioribacteraceae bacterium]|nr:glutamyl-tRNA reductase [Melioribacteraceae bacterium]MCF8355887.1 glutamyl-tRNA reductase [Melioribacteraceae bacterium]MCF8395204.1 glutamyl-tRNA reductase [Melioribacteraceae bacterium]MCF8420678.1 glutamyl-tRNA reductase [Melioribacteraceae bacterium]